ncbi:HD domain-containing protein [Paenibacillus hexagrammi]|uniref:HD domain-containing protein n=1 Tax=Paenibacillus hexagrammi TaxID=2908839 RepID=A0ABY3SQL9_9BACL|nr:HD domain-containing protein [Paenibacillus sp. YPD9-1]UJF36236.1 HD domain-containing protein [Paenibacillus sp. YPD9-1]
MEHTFTSGMIWEPLYRLEVEAHPVEIALFRSQPVRRLKFLHHFGASALFSPMNHSRFEHTVGVWALMAYFFPDQLPLRLAALLHDIGHLPFSHAVESTLGFDHHERTGQLIARGEVADILLEHGLQPEMIVNILQEASPLTNKTTQMGLDHLDSFLRDTYHAGRYLIAPHELIRKLVMRGHYIEADQDAAYALVHAVVEDHRIFLKPEFLAMDALLAKAITHHCEAHPGARALIPALTDNELIQELLHSEHTASREIMNVLMYEPHRIQIASEPIPGSIQVNIRKLYTKQPLISGKPASAVDSACQVKLDELDDLSATYFFTI